MVPLVFLTLLASQAVEDWPRVAVWEVILFGCGFVYLFIMLGRIYRANRRSRYLAVTPTGVRGRLKSGEIAFSWDKLATIDDELLRSEIGEFEDGGILARPGERDAFANAVRAGLNRFRNPHETPS